MTEQILSAGVYTSENDQSYYGQGTAGTTLALVGPSEKGPAFVPTEVTSYDQFTAFFGSDGSNSYLPQTAYSYLQAGNSINVTRILGTGGYAYGNTKRLAALISGSVIYAVFYPTKNASSTVGITGSAAGPESGSFSLKFWATSGSGNLSSSFSASLDPTATNYISKVIGTDENFQTGSVFPYLLFTNFVTASQIIASSSDNISTKLKFTVADCVFTSSNSAGYNHASTPWVLADSGVQLFKIHHRSDGYKSNKDVKVYIDNIRPGSTPESYSTFDVIVRKWDDSDRYPSILEQYLQVNLNPSDVSYIGKIIGDKYMEYDSTLNRVVEYGDYENKSKYIRIETTRGVSDGAIHPQLYPNGYDAIYETIVGFGSYTLPAAVNISSVASSYVFSGFDYANSDNWNYLNPVPVSASVGLNVAYSKPAGDDKFALPFQGGVDGMDLTIIKNKGVDITESNYFGYDLSTSTSKGTLSFQKAFDILASEEYTYDLLAMPGVVEEYHRNVTDAAQTLAEERTDFVYLRDLTGVNTTVSSAVLIASALDSNYSAAYYPWIKVKDINTQRDTFVPPTVIVPQAYAYNDKVAAEWFAPAGLNRGGLEGAIDTRIRLTKADRDLLYNGRVNPIAKFQNTGVVIWGQKTLQVKDTALNRINVRRLLINLRGYISNVALNYVFENNTLATRNNLVAAIVPYMESVQTRQGLYAFRVQIDDALNTNDVIDRNQLIGKIYVSPVKSIEFILLEFNITGTGVSFQ